MCVRCACTYTHDTYTHIHTDAQPCARTLSRHMLSVCVSLCVCVCSIDVVDDDVDIGRRRRARKQIAATRDTHTHTRGRTRTHARTTVGSYTHGSCAIHVCECKRTLAALRSAPCSRAHANAPSEQTPSPRRRRARARECSRDARPLPHTGGNLCVCVVVVQCKVGLCEIRTSSRIYSW